MCKKQISIVFLLVAIIFVGCDTKEEVIEEKSSVKVVKVFDLKKSTGHAHYFSYPAEIFAFQDVTMAFELNGKITDFYYKEGEKVVKSSVIAKLDDTIYKANYDAAQANYNQAKIDYERYSKLYMEKNKCSMSQKQICK